MTGTETSMLFPEVENLAYNYKTCAPPADDDDMADDDEGELEKETVTLSEDTEVGGVAWSTLKETAMHPDFVGSIAFNNLSSRD